MLYSNFIKKIRKCPFCHCQQEIIYQNKTAFLTFALAPYHPYHLLVIPKRHIVSFLHLKTKERENIDKLIRQGISKLHQLKIKNISVLVRDGSLAGSGKSILHLHYHIIPNTHIGNLNHRGQPRKILSVQQIKKTINKLKNMKDKS